jgi:putative transcriptional regulator
MRLQVTPRLSAKPVRFPNRIREYRLRAGLTQAALGALVGRHRKVVSSWEQGFRFPSGPVSLRLGKALDTLLEGLYGDLYASFRPGQDSTQKTE